LAIYYWVKLIPIETPELVDEELMRNTLIRIDVYTNKYAEGTNELFGFVVDQRD